MIVKPHFNEFHLFKDIKNSYSNILFLVDFVKYSDIYEFLPACDCLISDYSGIIFGFLNTLKPIITFAYDLDEYLKNDMGFIYDIREVVPGPICLDEQDFFDALRHIYDEGYFDEKKAVLLRNRFIPFHDGKTKERIYRKITELIGIKL